MKKTAIKYGIYSLLCAYLLFAAVLILGNGLGNSNQELLTYGTILISLSFVFLGIRSYRDHENNGELSFADAIKTGMLISVFAAFGMALMDMTYTSIINPDWGSEYITTTLESVKGKLSAEEYKIEEAALIKQMEDYSHPLILGAMMFFLTILIGFIITLISALILKTKK